MEIVVLEEAAQLLQVVGLGLVLTFATLIFVRGVSLAIRGKHHAVRFGVEMLLVFTVLFLFTHIALQLVGVSQSIEPLEKAVAFLWWISLAFTINASLNRFVWAGVLSENGVRKVPKLLTDGAALLLYGFAVMVVLHYVYDKSITTILATSGAAAFIVGLSAQSTLREVFAGLSLNMTRSLRIGDFVEIDDIYGEVHDINWRSVSLLNPHTSSLYIFPNSAVAEKTILNFSEPTGRFKYWVKFHVEYGASPDLVIRTIAEELENSKYVRRDPKPDFNIMGFTDLGMEYRVRFYFDGDDPWWDAQNEVCMAIWSSLRRKGIRLSIDRHKLLSGDEQQTNPWKFDNLRGPDEHLLQDLARDSFLGQLDPSKLQELASSARFLDFTPPDCIFHKNDAADAVYFITEGQFSAHQVQDDGNEAPIGLYQAGECIGLKCLTEDGNENHPITVRAERYSTVYKLDLSILKEMVSASENVRIALDKAMEKRNEQQQQYLRLHAASRNEAEQAKHHAAINLHVREHIEDIFSKPLLHRFLHALSPRTLEKDLLEAIMAACALIAYARGQVDDADRNFLRERFGTIGLFKHVEIDEGLKLFEHDVQNIRNNEELGTHTAQAKIRAISKEPRLARIVMGTSHGMTSLHSEQLESERSQIEQIAAILNLPAEIEGLVGAIKN
ncbi:MAG: small-conductance mechanosensitive channel/CRP-like cAMP-binding protein [Gammaproteobacteria bacterium]|jgi:small-conductance mechanosensitive channel/CRP-like cAMP-binding protein